MLQREVRVLKGDFRQRLAELEAEFVQRAEGLSNQLASSVAQRKNQCEVQLEQHASTLRQSIRALNPTPPPVEYRSESSDDEARARPY